MGQNLSADATEIVHFRKMVKHTYYNNVAKLEKHTLEASLGFQISRASFLELCNRTEGRIAAIADTRQREAKMAKHVDEKMEFFAAVEEGKIVLGDTLLHLAARLAHVDVIEFLLEKGLHENVPNFHGHFAHQVCLHPSIQMLMDDVVLVHDVLGFDHDDEAKAHRIVRNLRRLWPLWMFDSSETAHLVKVVGDVRSSHPFLNKYIKIANAMADRYRFRVTMTCLPIAIELLQQNEIKAYDAKRAFQAWPTPDKLQLVWDVLTTHFPKWTHVHDVEKDVAYLQFIQDAMAAWITIADDFRLYYQDEAANNMPTPDTLQNYERQIWKSRLGPSQDEVEDLCAHIDGVQRFTRLSQLKA
ncbi:hypothetical protein AC1031_002910 [Aphanomyces cochlioides]|nr:hypothetical protein AC1031_002910 [Aphanomyces cochlioides]